MKTGSNNIGTILCRVYIYCNHAATAERYRERISSSQNGIVCISNPDSLLKQLDPTTPACVITEFDSDDDHAATVPARLAQAAITTPTIFLVLPDDVCAAARALRAGGFNVFEQDTPAPALMRGIDYAIRWHKDHLESNKHTQNTLERRRCLSPREREILDLVISGYTTRQIAELLARTEKTIEFHRRNIMRKMDAPNIATLVRMIVTLPLRYHTAPQATTPDRHPHP